MAANNIIKIVRGDDTNWNGVNFLTIKLVSDLIDFSSFKAIFILGNIIKTFNDISSGLIPLNFTAQETKNLPAQLNGILRLVDNRNRVATIESYIPFNVVSGVHGDAIVTEPYEITFNVEQGGQNIMNISIEGGLSVEVGTTTTLPAGSAATVTNSGTFNHLVLDFGIPKGERGDIGSDIVNTINGMYGDVILGASDVGALPDTTTIYDLTDSEQQASLNSGITEELTSQITINANDILDLQNAGYITGITYADVTEALGFTPLSDTTTINDLTTLAQQKALNSGATVTNIGQISTNADDILAINDLIPVQATSENQLADKNFVNSSVSTNTANFIGTFNSLADLEAYSGVLTNNDYAFVISTDSAGNTVYNRYKYNGTEWLFEYALNNSSFTANQWASVNSGITANDVELIGTALQPNDNITSLNNNAGYISGITSTDVTTALGFTPYDSTNPNNYTTKTYVDSIVGDIETLLGEI